MPIVTDHGFEADVWSRAQAEEALSGRVIVSLEDLERRENPLSSDVEALGLDLPNDADLDAVTPHFDRLTLIAVAFPSFADGRGFSLARRLRARGYRGTLRASGALVADQYAFARACGFDEVEISDAMAARQPVEQWRYDAARPGWYQRNLATASQAV